VPALKCELSGLGDRNNSGCQSLPSASAVSVTGETGPFAKGVRNSENCGVPIHRGGNGSWELALG